MEAVPARLARLATLPDLTAEMASVEQSAAADQADDLYELAVALPIDPRGPWQYATMRRTIVRALALTPGRRNAALAVAVVAETFPLPPPSVPEAALRSVASMLAAAQPLQHLVPLYHGPTDEPTRELLRCLGHELVLRHGRVTAPEILALMAEPGHPLAGLPPHRLELEHGVPLPRYHLRGSSVPGGYGFGPARLVGIESGPRPSTVDITGGDERVLAAVRNWATGSNGRYEAGLYRLSAPVDDGWGPALLAGLPLEALRDADPDRVRVSRSDAAEVFNGLFAAAAHGGAYNSGEHGGYGRLRAWQSLGAMVGAAEADPPDRIAELAAGCTYRQFITDTGWYDDVAWDVGIAVLRADRRVLAVLTATDTD